MKVKQAFIDRDTGYSYKPGDIYRGSEERIEELRDSGHLTKTDVPDAAPAPAVDVDVTPPSEPEPAPSRKK